MGPARGTPWGRLSAAGPVAVARTYFAGQAVAGAVWWVCVLGSDPVRRATLGGWRPELLVGPDLALFVVGSALAAVSADRRWALVVLAWSGALTVALGVSALATREAGWGALLMVVATGGSAAAASVLRRGRLPTEWFFVGPFRFRPARAGSRARHVWQSLLQVVVVWSLFFGLLPGLLAVTERRVGLTWSALRGPAQVWIGLVLFVLASGVGIWACVTMAVRGEGTPLPAAAARRLVVAGPYRQLRNPMAASGALQGCGVGLALGSWLVLVTTLAGAAVWQLVIRPAEEADLAARFGPDFAAYRARVGLWLPAVSRRAR